MTDASAAGLRVEEVRTVERLTAIAREWEELCDRAIDPLPTLRHAFLLAWIESFGAGIELRILLLWDGESLVAAAPLGLRTERLLRQDLRVVGLLANAWVDRSSILLRREDGALLDIVVQHVLTSTDRVDAVMLGPVADDSILAGMIRASVKRNGWRHAEEVTLRSPFLRLPPSMDTLLAGISSSFRATVRRKLRQVERTPGLRLETQRGVECLAAINGISPETWQAEEGTAMTSRPEIISFYKRVIEDAALRDALRCGILYVDDVPVAFDFNIRGRDTLHSFKMGFRSSQAALSAGLILKVHMLAGVIEGDDRGLREYDFMGTSEPYKLNWTSDVRSHSRHLVFARKPKLIALHWLLFRVRPYLRERMPGVWSRLKRLRRG